MEHRYLLGHIGIHTRIGKVWMVYSLRSVVVCVLLIGRVCLAEWGPPGVAARHRGWVVKDRLREVTEVLESEVLTVNDITEQYDMLRLCRSGDVGKDEALTNSIFRGVEVQLLSMYRRAQELNEVTKWTTSIDTWRLYLDGAFRLFMERSPKRLIRFPSLLASGEVGADEQNVYVRALLAVLWECDDPRLVRATCTEVVNSIKGLSDENRGVLRDVMMRADVFAQGSQREAWLLLWELMRPATMESALHSSHRHQSNIWLTCIKKRFKKLEPSIPLAMASGGGISPAEQYVLLDWSCRAWNSSLRDVERSKSSSGLIGDAVRTFYQQHGKEVASKIDADESGLLLDFLRGSYGADLEKKRGNALLGTGK